LAAIASGVSAEFLLQAQDLVSQDMVQAAATHGRGAVDFFLNRLTSAGKVILVASMISTAAICFVSMASWLAIIRALVESWSDESERSWPAHTVLGASEWVRPVPFMFFSLLMLGFVGYTLYIWVPNSLHL